MPASMIIQKDATAIGARIGAIPESQGTIMPMQPSHSRTPNTRIGIIELLGF
jgi:hypothetical protein